MYADDCLIYAIGNNSERMVPNVQTGLDGFQCWCVNNCMKLNVRKSKSLVIGTQHKISNINTVYRFKLGDLNLEHVNEYSYSGDVLDSMMTYFLLERKSVS